MSTGGEVRLDADVERLDWHRRVHALRILVVLAGLLLGVGQDATDEGRRSALEVFGSLDGGDLDVPHLSDTRG